jgi:hypothetical protein
MTVVKLPLDDDRCPGAVAEFEVADEPGTELLAARRARTDTVPSLAASLDRSLPALSLILAKLRAAATDADELTVNLGLTVGGETGLVFVKGSAEATIAVSITWRRTPTPDPDHGHAHGPA